MNSIILDNYFSVSASLKREPISADLLSITCFIGEAFQFSFIVGLWIRVIFYSTQNLVYGES